MNTNITATVQIPSILTANVYFWRPGFRASERRRNEERRRAEIKNFLAAARVAELENVSVKWEYRESCTNVHLRFQVYRNGKRSNIKGLAAECRKLGVEIVS